MKKLPTFLSHRTCETGCRCHDSYPLLRFMTSFQNLGVSTRTFDFHLKGHNYFNLSVTCVSKLRWILCLLSRHLRLVSREQTPVVNIVQLLFIGNPLFLPSTTTTKLIEIELPQSIRSSSMIHNPKKVIEYLVSPLNQESGNNHQFIGRTYKLCS